MASTRSTHQPPPFFEGTRLVNIVIDTPKGSPFKLKFDEEARIFRVHKAMPLGIVFPFNFGFIPGTRADDGDALDVLLLTTFTLPVGAATIGKLIAVLEAEQIEQKKKQRNDRLIAIPVEQASGEPMQPKIEFSRSLKNRISEFFVKYNELQGRSFRPLRFTNSSEAIRIVKLAMR